MTNIVGQLISKMRLPAAFATMVLAFMLGLMAWSAQAQTFSVLYSFADSPDGAYPYAGLVRDKAGNLYGTAEAGGANGYGAVYKLDTTNHETILYSFRGGTDGAQPTSLILGANGDLYGITMEGGGTGCDHSFGCGTVFKVNRRGQETVLYSFTGSRDGGYPSGPLLQDAQGNLFGTTEIGGDLSCYPTFGCGTVFRISKTGQETVLRAFNENDGFQPDGGVISDNYGNLYGTTASGGDPGYGTVFELTRTRKVSTLYHFAEPAEGQFPNAGLTYGRAGVFYGTTVQGGNYGYGTVFKVNKAGQHTLLYSFSGAIDGANPFAGVVVDAKGNLYGETEMGGPFSLGVVYKLDTRGTLTLLQVFGGSDGEYPFGNLLQDANGVLYGTTAYGGSAGYGTVWKLTP